jgi:hypothetical protein
VHRDGALEDWGISSRTRDHVILAPQSARHRRHVLRLTVIFTRRTDEYVETITPDEFLGEHMQHPPWHVLGGHGPWVLRFHAEGSLESYYSPLGRAFSRLRDFFQPRADLAPAVEAAIESLRPHVDAVEPPDQDIHSPPMSQIVAAVHGDRSPPRAGAVLAAAA